MYTYKITLLVLLTLGVCLCSCKDLVEIEAPKNSLVPATVFRSNDLATAAVLGIYQQMAASGYASGGAQSLSVALGLSADEFIGYSTENQQLAQNQLLSYNAFALSTWTALYARIYNANTILEGLERSEGVTPPVKNQLKGEVLFTRAFNYFYLVNLYGPVPLHLGTDYQLNSKASRAEVNQIYHQVLADLQMAEQLLPDAYITTERVRPNRAAVHMLLARTYLYLQNWPNAEKYASRVIEKTATYKLTGLDQVFLSNSQENIWQLAPPAGSNTPAGALLNLTTAPAGSQVALRPDFVLNAFEPADQRKTTWAKSIAAGNSTFYYPYKYKVRASTVVTEYTSVLRLAELLLIRAEARALQNNLPGAIDDLDAIRFRAGLFLVKNTDPDISKTDLLKLIEKERRVELFSEWGHRWFDLKRAGRSAAVLAPIKPKWKATYTLFPIPKAETERNRNISQNEGYEN
ncbi:hypothetical protein ABIE26_000198 [Pedobacter africanus]|uniref:Uncharacterized protein n=1 Tax=Pedobacter africanus TaxID=151894 RepID=A0ACC6KVY8_9SPHI|nr:RagB/SusD family nutrient uptake outer membrane protein [Pedobacter africanus]MDR6783314.1 hypothetical protein [Pedobacter africanus]